MVAHHGRHQQRHGLHDASTTGHELVDHDELQDPHDRLDDRQPAFVGQLEPDKPHEDGKNDSTPNHSLEEELGAAPKECLTAVQNHHLPRDGRVVGAHLRCICSGSDGLFEHGILGVRLGDLQDTLGGLVAELRVGAQMVAYEAHEVLGRVGVGGAVEAHAAKVIHSFRRLALVSDPAICENQEVAEVQEDITGWLVDGRNDRAWGRTIGSLRQLVEQLEHRLRHGRIQT
mmetsp:Transcript_60132/g.196400  ORF Transcript_60132/g.196400 Transcript_60132/m.196400 type:complete len:230 (+) Transcript_60132:948-1637(+)